VITITAAAAMDIMMIGMMVERMTDTMTAISVVQNVAATMIAM
jgi:hypothetical protein